MSAAGVKTRKALKNLPPGDRLEVLCTDPLSVIDIPNLIRETGDKVEITERSQDRIVFLIEKTNGSIGKGTYVNGFGQGTSRTSIRRLHQIA